MLLIPLSYIEKYPTFNAYFIQRIMMLMEFEDKAKRLLCDNDLSCTLTNIFNSIHTVVKIIDKQLIPSLLIYFELLSLQIL